MSDVDSAADSAAAGSGLSDEERAELERLRAERAKAKRRYFSWRPTVATILIVIGCLLAPIAVLGVWSANQISDTSRYVANMEPLVHEPAIQNALTDKITAQITSHLNVTAYTDQAAGALNSKGLTRVGTLLQSVAPQITGAVDGFIHGQVQKIVASPQFAQLWVQANTRIHQAVVKALSGQGNGSITTSNGKVVLNLGPFIDLVKQDLVKRGLTIVNKVPAINPTFPLFSDKYLVKAQTGYRLINDLKIVLPILALLFLALGVFTARGHRRALIGAGLGLAASMLVLAAGLLIFRSIYLNSVPSNVLPADAAAVLFDTLVRFIKEGLRALLVIGLVVAAAAFLTGPSAGAVRIRAWTASRLRLAAAGHRACRRANRPGRDVDLRASQGAPDRGHRPLRADLRVRGPAHRRLRDSAGHPAAARARADRADRWQAARTAGDGGPSVKPPAGRARRVTADRPSPEGRPR